jgi:tetratricopeptide (TPR) repeat protein
MALMAILAIAMMLLLHVRTSGAADSQPPQFLPDVVADWQETVNKFRGGNFTEARDRMQSVRDRLAPWMPLEQPVDRGMLVWSALAAQACGQPDRAMIQWGHIELAGGMRAWKHLAITAIHLERGHNDDAAEELAKAQLIQPDNALVHYYLGILHLQQAENAIDWPDYVRTPTFRFAVYTPNVSPNTKGMYQLAATMELEHAINGARKIDGELPLIPMEWNTSEAFYPTVNDLLLAMGATQFEPNSHHMLAYLCLERGALEVAEEHLDRANELGISVPFIFNDLGARYETQGRNADAARAYLKGVKNGPDRVGALMRFMQNLGDTLEKQP